MQLIANSTGGRLPKFWRPPYGDSDARVSAIAREVRVIFSFDIVHILNYLWLGIRPENCSLESGVSFLKLYMIHKILKEIISTADWGQNMTAPIQKNLQQFLTGM